MPGYFKLPFALSLLAFCGVSNAQTSDVDSISAKELKEVVVEGQLQSTSAKVTTYIPTAKQKNASQTANDLLSRMAIPQLAPGMSGEVKTNGGKEVDIFIDFVPASQDDLTGMLMADVKKIEYYDYPADPRFQGKAHVINFIMQKYEYGGYLKASANEFFIANSGQLNLFSKFQYKKMTYDLALGGYYSNNGHQYTNSVETYRLPQPDSEKEFQRSSITTEADTHRRYFWPTFKAQYRTEKITLVNSLGATFDNYPKDNTSGAVFFNPEDYPRTDFNSQSSHRNNYITYNGYWFFILPKDNTITFSPFYSYSNTKQNSLYSEGIGKDYLNDATDNAHSFRGTLSYHHDFGKWGNIGVSARGSYTHNRTRYSGTANASERLSQLDLNFGLSYNLSTEKFEGNIGVGVVHSETKVNTLSDKSTVPWIDVNLNYAFNSRNSINLDFHHANMQPGLSYRSSALIHPSPLMSYTGNPYLTPYHSYDLGLYYLWLPDNKFSFTAFGNGFLTTNRFAYVYEASADGVMRTVQQPLGKFLQGSVGVNATARFLDGNLQISGQLSYLYCKNGYPFNFTKTHPNWHLQAFYFLGQWNFGLQYQSEMGSADGFVRGTWTATKDAYTAIVGWGNSSWNLRAIFANPFRWNWRSGTTSLKTKSYDFVQTDFTPNNHCFIYLSATYTFGFGKKINIGNEASQLSGADNAILK